MKKVLFIALMAFVVIATLAISACGGTATTTTPAQTTSTPKPTSTTPGPTSTTPKPTTSTPGPTTSSPTPDANKYGGVIRLVLTAGPATPLGYPPESAPDSYVIGYQALERLIRVKLDSSIEPLLATAWDVAPDGKSITFTLRKGVKFHDGSDFNAAAVKWNFDRAMEAKKAPNWNSVEAIDDYTIRINIKTYQNTSLTQLGDGAFQIISPTAVEKNGLDWARANPVGTGPFKFVKYDRDSLVVFEKNPNYWDPGKPYLDGIQWVVIADESVRKIAFIRGDIHRLQVGGLVAQELQAQGYEYNASPGGTFVLVPDSNNASSPYADIRVRQAISYAINRDALAQGLGYGFARPAYQIFPGYAAAALPNLPKTEFNPAKAKQLLADAGYPSGFKTSIPTFIRQVPRDYVTAVAKMLTDVGIKATAEFPESGKYDELRFNGWSDSMLAHGIASFPNLNTVFSFYFGQTAFPSVKRPDGFTDAVNASLATKEFDPAKFQAVIKLMTDDLTVIPYVEETVVSFRREGVHDPGIEQYDGKTFMGSMAWLEPSAR